MSEDVDDRGARYNEGVAACKAKLFDKCHEIFSALIGESDDNPDVR